MTPSAAVTVPKGGPRVEVWKWIAGVEATLLVAGVVAYFTLVDDVVRVDDFPKLLNQYEVVTETKLKESPYYPWLRERDAVLGKIKDLDDDQGEIRADIRDIKQTQIEILEALREGR